MSGKHRALAMLALSLTLAAATAAVAVAATPPIGIGDHNDHLQATLLLALAGAGRWMRRHRRLEDRGPPAGAPRGGHRLTTPHRPTAGMLQGPGSDRPPGPWTTSGPAIWVVNRSRSSLRRRPVEWRHQRSVEEAARRVAPATAGSRPRYILDRRSIYGGSV